MLVISIAPNESEVHLPVYLIRSMTMFASAGVRSVHCVRPFVAKQLCSFRRILTAKPYFRALAKTVEW
jgi:hypothetical protein